jgi:PAS domain S-box-containing protein
MEDSGPGARRRIVVGGARGRDPAVGRALVMLNEQRRDRYAEIFEHAPIGRLITDEVGTIMKANRSAAEMFHVAPSYLVGKQLSTYVPEDDRRELRERLRGVARTTRPRKWLMWLRPGGDRSPFRAEVHVVASRSEAGHLHWAIADVTERMAMEQELRTLTSQLERRVEERTREVDAERARLAAVVDQIPAGLTIIGADGNVVMANAEAHRLLGQRVNDEFQEGRLEVPTADGGYAVLDVRTAPIFDAGGAELGAVRVFHDVSELERRERAEREFVTNAAHQLQSPLAGILSAVEVLQAGAKDGPQRDVFLGHVERESNRLARLARALLVLARAQTGHEAPKDEIVGLEALLSEARNGIRAAAGVSVEVDCPPDLAVVTNRELVEQALMNVADNAGKYTTEGTIILSARALDGGAEIIVADTGPGIPKGEQEQVLERFYRGSVNGAEGFGLGFAIARSALDAVGGELDLSEREGGGTIVKIRLGQAANLVSTE